MKKKFIDFIVRKCWESPTFRSAVSDNIKESPIRFFKETLNKVYTVKNGVVVLHDTTQASPYVYTSLEEVIAAAKQLSPKPLKKVGRKTKKDDSGVKKTV